MNKNMYMTVSDVQEALHLGKNKTYALFNQKSFPSIRIGGKHVIAKKDLEDWFNKIKKIPGKRYEL